jgi:hypothetical protein
VFVLQTSTTATEHEDEVEEKKYRGWVLPEGTAIAMQFSGFLLFCCLICGAIACIVWRVARRVRVLRFCRVEFMK